MTKDPNRSLATIDGYIWLFVGVYAICLPLPYTLCNCNLFIKTKSKPGSEIKHYFSVPMINVHYNFQYAVPWVSLVQHSFQRNPWKTNAAGRSTIRPGRFRSQQRQTGPMANTKYFSNITTDIRYILIQIRQRVSEICLTCMPTLNYIC